MKRKRRCDAQRPSCSQCIKHGHVCPGYEKDLIFVNQTTVTLRGRDQDNKPSKFSSRRYQRSDRVAIKPEQSRIESLTSLTPNPQQISPIEARAIEFFNVRVSRTLAEPHSSYFWTNLVLQLGRSEPAVRHAIVAISSIYEKYNCENEELLLSKRNEVALQHYSAAVTRLRQVKESSTILVACVLFICLEVILGNRDQAITHTRHGLEILRTVDKTTRKTLTPIFQRLKVMVLMFGVQTPPIQGFTTYERPTYFATTFQDAEEALEELLPLSLQFVRSADEYRFGELATESAPDDLLGQQEILAKSIDNLQDLMGNLRENFPHMGDADARYSSFVLRAKFCQIWIATALEKDEMQFDAWMDTFREMIVHTEILGRTIQRQKRSRIGPEIRFEIGFIPLAYFILMKCRDRSIRLKALRLITEYGTSRESFWEKEKMVTVGTRIIEIENKVKLNGGDQILSLSAPGHLPSVEDRIWDTTFSPKRLIAGGYNGEMVTGAPMGFIMRNNDGRWYVRHEFIALGALTNENKKPRFVQLDETIIEDLDGSTIARSKCPMS
ncbi:unnamed protein product [Clonostachys byssicola]|uniref:Zn(2)-C6 fungal-type domain-containing protein n=1 Tax=Clonostachys byssicola TaxID=160290 RepID=A0A9N9U5G6_9HYPO|nr:unnamed protein product [Clonostachys byssicola]